MPRNIFLLPILAAMLVLAPGPAAAQGAAPAQTRPLDPANRDTTCSACEDFYRWANGGWIERTPRFVKPRARDPDSTRSRCRGAPRLRSKCR